MLELVIDKRLLELVVLATIFSIPLKTALIAYNAQVQCENAYRINRDDALWKLCAFRAIYNVLLTIGGLVFFALSVLVMVYKP